MMAGRVSNVAKVSEEDAHRNRQLVRWQPQEMAHVSVQDPTLERPHPHRNTRSLGQRPLCGSVGPSR